MTVLVDGCAVCNGRGQVAEGQACPVCGGTGVSTAAEAASYRQLMVDAAVKAAAERFARAGTESAEGVLRDLAAARADAEETRARAGQVLGALTEVRSLALETRKAMNAARAMSAPAEQAISGQIMPRSLPVTPPGMPVQPIPGATRDPVLLIDSIYVRELDVWGVANFGGGSGGLLTNPMTTLGDIITALAAGVPARLGIGTAGQVLTVSGGVPTWQNSAAGFSNPMTTTGDLIASNPGATPVRVGIGTAGQVLTVVSGLPAWANSPAGFANPLTTTGDIMFSNPGSTPVRLGIGSAGQVLSVVAGLPAWVTNPSGFTNPMTTAGDMITGTSGGAAVRLPAGPNGSFLTVVSGLPTWQLQPSLTVAPSGDTTGAQDIANINAAFTALSNTGTVQLLPNATYYINGQLSVPPFATIRGGGQSTVINCVGGFTGTYILVFNSSAPTYTRLSGNLFDFLVDGSGAGNGAIGVQFQDTNGVQVRLGIRNFSGTGSVGLQLANNTHSLNQMVGYVAIVNCTNAIVFTALGAQTAIEHIYLILSIQLSAGQNGIVLSNNVGVQGSELKANIGVNSASAGNCIQFGSGCVFADTNFLFKAELTNPAITATTVSFNGAGSGFSRTTGILFFSPNLLTSNIGSANGKVVHFGTINNDSTMTAQATPPSTPPGLGTYDQTAIITPAFPGASGTAVQNNTGIPVHITVAGGTLSAVTVVNGVNVGDLNTRVFYLPRNQSITLSWSAAPTGWVWQPVG